MHAAQNAPKRVKTRQGDACWTAAKDGEYARGRTKHSTEWQGYHPCPLDKNQRTAGGWGGGQWKRPEIEPPVMYIRMAIASSSLTSTTSILGHCATFSSWGRVLVTMTFVM